MAQATMQTAFGRQMQVEVLGKAGGAARVRLSTGNEAVISEASLDWTTKVVEAAAESVITEPGLYQQDGVVYKVQVSKTSGKPYAKRLIVIGGKRLMESGDKANLEYEYAPGAVRSLRPEDKMDLEAAKRFGIEYGFCVRCGAFLKDADSVEAGIGPVCRKWFA